jgi:hypothetical protein
VLYLPGHDRRRDAFRFECLDEFSKLAEIQPVYRLCVLFNVRRCFFLYRGNNHFDALAPGGFQNKKWEFAVAGNQPDPIL